MLEKSIILRLLGDPKIEGREHLFFCPYCKYEKKKFSVNFNRNKYKCWICGKSGSDIRNIILDFGSESTIKEVFKFQDIQPYLENYKKTVKHAQISNLEEKKDINLEFGYSLVNHYNSDLPHVKYLKEKRNMKYSDFVYWKPYISSDERFQNYVFFPSYDSEFRVNYYCARDITDLEKFKYKTPKGFLSDPIIFNEYNIDWSKPITIVEGVFDAVAGGSNFIPLLGSSLSTDSKLYEKIILSEVETYLLLDGDAENKAKSIIRNFLKFGHQVKFVKLPNHLDPGQMTREEISIAKTNYKIYNNEFQLKIDTIRG